MERLNKLTILIVDDQSEVLEIYREVLEGLLHHQVECVYLAGEAIRHTVNRLFDVVIIDAKIPYKGAPLGGLLLADEVGTVLGIGSIILMSQYDVKGEVAAFNPTYTFIPKPRPGMSLFSWIEKDLMTKIQGMVRRQYGFVVMPFNDPIFDNWYQTTLTPWLREAGYEIKRMDEISTTRAINSELLQKIRESHFVVLYAPKTNPNIYFEAGYATALNKYLLLFSPNVDELPFDIRTNRCFPVVQSDNQEIKKDFLRFMAGLRGL
jgi:CheY-like chemotaxis protein